MKKVLFGLLFTLVTIVIFSCGVKPKPLANYECKDYFSNSDWDLTLNKTQDTILFYNLNKNVSVKKDFPSSTDSVKFSMSFDEQSFKKLPPQDTLEHKIFKCLLNGGDYS